MIDHERRHAIYCDGVWDNDKDCPEFFDPEQSGDPYQHGSEYEAKLAARKHGWEIKGMNNRDKDLCPTCIEGRTGTRFPENGGVDPRFGTALTLGEDL